MFPVFPIPADPEHPPSDAIVLSWRLNGRVDLGERQHPWVPYALAALNYGFRRQHHVVVTDAIVVHVDAILSLMERSEEELYERARVARAAETDLEALLDEQKRRVNALVELDVSGKLVEAARQLAGVSAIIRQQDDGDRQGMLAAAAHAEALAVRCMDASFPMQP